MGAQPVGNSPQVGSSDPASSVAADPEWNSDTQAAPASLSARPASPPASIHSSTTRSGPLSSLTKGDRRAIFQALAGVAASSRYDRVVIAEQLEADGFVPLAAKLRRCGFQALPLVCNGCAEPLHVAVPESCQVAGCPRCSRRRALRVIASVLITLRTLMASPRPGFRLMLLTLTFRKGASDREALYKQEPAGGSARAGAAYRSRGARLRALAVRRFLRRVYPKRGGAGGYFALEIGGSGNLHAHALVWGPFVPQRELSRLWREISRLWRCVGCGWEHPQGRGRGGTRPTACERCGGFDLEPVEQNVVDIRQARRPRRAALYILAYLAKPVVGSDPDLLSWWAWSMRGVRRYGAWGAAHPLRSEPPQRLVCPLCGDGFALEASLLACLRAAGISPVLAELVGDGGRDPPAGGKAFLSLDELRELHDRVAKVQHKEAWRESLKALERRSYDPPRLGFWGPVFWQYREAVWGESTPTS